MKRIESLTVSFRGREVGRLGLSPDRHFCVFEYSKAWLIDGFSISPLELPLKEGTFIAKPAPFNGGFGVFEDSLPDGYGRYLLKKTLYKSGINDSDLTILDRLSLVGDNGMGALCFAPSNILPSENEVNDFDWIQQRALEVLKEQQDEDAGLLLYNSGNSGGARPKAIFSDADGHWLVKFRHIYDSKNIGKEEFRCNEMARACGIDVPDYRLINGRYFASRRFDISDKGERLHTSTVGGILGVSHNTPILDYSNILALTGYITQSEEDVEEMFRRMVFNYKIDNKDDHSKNFSFRVMEDDEGKWRWRLAPAYDLTPCEEGYNGQHATSVNGTGFPVETDFIAVGTKINMTERRCKEIISEIERGIKL